MRLAPLVKRLDVGLSTSVEIGVRVEMRSFSVLFWGVLYFLRCVDCENIAGSPISPEIIYRGTCHVIVLTESYSIIVD